MKITHLKPLLFICYCTLKLNYTGSMQHTSWVPYSCNAWIWNFNLKYKYLSYHFRDRIDTPCTHVVTKEKNWWITWEVFESISLKVSQLGVAEPILTNKHKMTEHSAEVASHGLYQTPTNFCKILQPTIAQTTTRYFTSILWIKWTG